MHGLAYGGPRRGTRYHELVMAGVRNDDMFDRITGRAGRRSVGLAQFGRNDPVVFRADHDLRKAQGQQFHGAIRT